MGSAVPTRLTRRSRMAQVQGNNLLDVLKKKMRQTKEEMEKYKEESEDMARKLQVEIRRREEVAPLQKSDPASSFLVRGNPLKPSFCCRDLWHAAAPASAVAAGVGPWLVWWDESEWDSGFEPVPSRQQLKSRSPPEDCHVAWMLRATRGRTNTLIPKCPKKGIRPPHRHRADAIVGPTLGNCWLALFFQ